MASGCSRTARSVGPRFARRTRGIARAAGWNSRGSVIDSAIPHRLSPFVPDAREAIQKERPEREEGREMRKLFLTMLLTMFLLLVACNNTPPAQRATWNQSHWNQANWR
jgi:hypothetical protein